MLSNIKRTENLRFFGRLYGVESSDAAHDVLLERVGLADDADRPIGEYSQGWRSASLARALLPRPQILLLDNPSRAWTGRSNWPKH